MSNEANQKKRRLKNWSPASLKFYALEKVAKMLARLNDSEIDSEFPWLRVDLNPFVGIPYTLLEEIIAACKTPLRWSSKTVRLELLKILFCRKLKKINLNHFRMEEDDVLPTMKIIEATNSEVFSFEVEIFSDKYTRFSWLKIPNALNYLKDYIRTLHFLTYLNVNYACDDEMMEAVGTSCPNLVVLQAISTKVTSRGLKGLCINTKETKDKTRRCQNLQKIVLEVLLENDTLIEGIQTLLFCLPQLRVLDCPCIAFGKAIEKLYSETHGQHELNLRKFHYCGSMSYINLQSVIFKMCPYLTSLSISNVSNSELQRFERIGSLRSVDISTYGNSVSFKDGVVPFLQRMGEPIESVTLYEFQNVDFNAIDEYCPNLKRLECCNILEILSGKVSGTPVFKNLEYLDVYSDSSSELQPSVCIRLLSSCHNLNYLSLDCCQDLSVNDLKTVLMRNPLKKLCRTYISSTTLFITGPPSEWDF